MFDCVHKAMEMMVCITSEIIFIDIKCYFFRVGQHVLEI